MPFFPPLSSLDKLHKELQNPSLLISQRRELLQLHRKLICEASAKDLGEFIDNNQHMLNDLVASLGLDELGKIGIKYASANLKRTLDFLNVLTALPPDHFQEILEPLLSFFSEKERVIIINQHPVLLAKTIGLILGLKGEQFERTTFTHGYNMVMRYTKLKTEHFNYEIPEKQSSQHFYTPSLAHGHLHSIHSHWANHTFLFHLIKDGQNTHLIYVNRGQSHEKITEDDSTVTLFTFTPKTSSKKISQLMSDLILCLKTQERTKISTFIRERLAPYLSKDEQLNQLLQKSQQKVNNCTAANSNNVWHFALATQKMRQEGCSLAEAYTQTKAAYKQLRMEDRVVAFHLLLSKPALEPYIDEALPQILQKMQAKEAQGKLSISSLIDALFEQEKKVDVLITLLKRLYEPSTHINPAAQKQWQDACIKKLEEKSKEEEFKHELIGSKIELFKILAKKNANAELEAHIKAHPSLINLLPRTKLIDCAAWGNDKELTHLTPMNVKFIFAELKKEQGVVGRCMQDNYIDNLSIEGLKLLINDEKAQNSSMDAELIKQCQESLNLKLQKIETQALYETYKERLAGILIKGARTTTCKEKQDLVSYLLKQLDQAKDIDLLVELIYKAERTFSHVRNPFLSRNMGCSRTNSYRATTADFNQLREDIKNGALYDELQTRLSPALEIIQDKHPKTFRGVSYRQMVNEMHANQASYPKQNEENSYRPK